MYIDNSGGDEGGSAQSAGSAAQGAEERLSDHIPGLGTFFLKKDKNSRKRRRDFVNLGRSQRAAIVRQAYTVVEAVCDVFCPGEKMDLLDAIVDIHPTYRRRYTKRVAELSSGSSAVFAQGGGVGGRRSFGGPGEAVGVGMGLGAVPSPAMAPGFPPQGPALGPPHGLPITLPQGYSVQFGAGGGVGVGGRPDDLPPHAGGILGAEEARGGQPPSSALDQLTRLAVGSLAQLRGNTHGNSNSNSSHASNPLAQQSGASGDWLRWGQSPGLPLPPPSHLQQQERLDQQQWQQDRQQHHQPQASDASDGVGDDVPLEAFILHKMRAGFRSGLGLARPEGSSMSAQSASTYPPPQQRAPQSGSGANDGAASMKGLYSV